MNETEERLAELCDLLVELQDADKSTKLYLIDAKRFLIKAQTLFLHMSNMEQAREQDDNVQR